MSVGITINGAEPVGQLLAGLSLALSQPGDLLKVLEREGTNRLKRHFLQREGVGNRLGGRRTGFWRQMADSLRSSLSGTELRISVTDPRFVQKVYGGTIRAKKAGALTIPVIPEAYGRTARTYEAETGNKLQVVIFKQPKGASIGMLCVKNDPAGKFFTVVFLLVSSVTQDKDPNALPDREEFQSGLIERARAYVGRITGRELPGAPLPPTP